MYSIAESYAETIKDLRRYAETLKEELVTATYKIEKLEEENNKLRVIIDLNQSQGVKLP